MRIALLVLILTPLAAAEALFLTRLRPPLTNIPLTWSPGIAWQAPDSLGYTGIGTRTIAVLPFRDARPNPTLIGSFTGKKNNKPPRLVTTASDVPAWCTVHVIEGLRHYGVSIAPDTAAYLMEIAVDSFYVRESDQYRGVVVLKVSVTKPETGARWSGKVMGGYEHWGRTYQLGNFLETYANSLITATEQLAKALPACLNALDASTPP